MNEKFYNLPEEKRQIIINSGFRVFSKNSYKKSPMGEIAAEAGISKSLLFHYFKNKKEFYLFLWDEGARITFEYLKKFNCFEKTNFFDALQRGTHAKMQIMKMYPDLTMFVIKAFYGKDPEVYSEIQQRYQSYIDSDRVNVCERFDPEEFAEGIDLEMMYKEMYWASEGFVWDFLQRGKIDPDKFEEEFSKLMEYWKKIYGRKKG